MFKAIMMIDVFIQILASLLASSLCLMKVKTYCTVCLCGWTFLENPCFNSITYIAKNRLGNFFVETRHNNSYVFALYNKMIYVLDST